MIATLKPSKKDPNKFPTLSFIDFCLADFYRISKSQCQVLSSLFRAQQEGYRYPPSIIYPRSFSHAEMRKFLLFNLRILGVSHSYSLTILDLWSFKSWMLNSHTWPTYLTFLTDVDLLFVVRTCLPTRRISCKFSYRF